MAHFGEVSIVATALLTLIAVWLGLFRKDAKSDDALRRIILAAATMGTVAGAVLVFLLVTHDYRVAYVRMYAARSMTLGYLVTALWGGQQGSLMFWAMLQSWCMAAVAYWFREKDERLIRVALGILGGIAVFFWLLVLTQSNPFKLNGEDPLTSSGLNPLLRNPYMVFHPPTLFLGFAGFSIPFAIGLAAMVRGRSDSEWLVPLRPFVLVAFAFLSVGNILGMVWAYEELGWGGYWGWDPVENASLMPWFTGTALVHAMMAQRRWGIMKRWTLSLIVVTWLLTIFGTFLTRSGIIQSVHAFSDATEGPYLLGIIGLVLVAFIILMIGRYKSLHPDMKVELWSRQWMFELSNWLFTAALLFVGLTTLWPLFHGLLEGEQAMVPPAFFNKWMVPIGLTLFATVGACTLLPGSKALRRPEIRRTVLSQAIVISILSAGAGLLVGIHPNLGGAMSVAPAISVGLIVFVMLSLFIQMRKSYLAGSRTRLGGQTVHLAMVLMYIGFTGAGFVTEKKANVGMGEFMYLDDVKITFLGLRSDVNYEREALFADLEVVESTGAVTLVSPARYLYHSHPKQPTSEVNILMGVKRDLFFILGETEAQTGRAVIKVLSNPLVIWIWLGGVLLVFGALLAMSRAGLRDVLQMKPAMRQRLFPLGVGAIAVAAVLLPGYLWLGVPGAIAFFGVLGLLTAFGLLMYAVVKKTTIGDGNTIEHADDGN